MELPLENLNEHEIFATRKRLFELFEINQSIAYKFALENYDLVKEIARLESSICPHSDEIITSWCLKK
ncbi:MAG: hypothetical protein K2H20_03235 [Bacilli bacterium]|nr:hypothetical protein [Bacilli bacterium]